MDTPYVVGACWAKASLARKACNPISHSLRRVESKSRYQARPDPLTSSAFYIEAHMAENTAGDMLAEYESDATLPKRRERKKRKPYAVEWLDDMFKNRPAKWVVISRYEMKERAERALIDKNKNSPWSDSKFRLKPEEGDGG